MARESPPAGAIAEGDAMVIDAGSLWERWQALKAAAPAVRAREAALALGVSETAIARCWSGLATRLWR